MAATLTLGVLRDRVVALCESQGYGRALQPFDFDQQPAQQLHKMFHLRQRKRAIQGYLGGDCDEDHEFQIFFAQRAHKDPWAAVRAVTVDLDLLQAAMESDFPAYDYNVLDDQVELTVNPPPQGQDYVVGRLTIICNITVDR